MLDIPLFNQSIYMQSLLLLVNYFSIFYPSVKTSLEMEIGISSSPLDDVKTGRRKLKKKCADILGTYSKLGV